MDILRQINLPKNRCGCARLIYWISCPGYIKIKKIDKKKNNRIFVEFYIKTCAERASISMLLNSTGIIPLVYKNVSNQCISQRNRSLCCMDSKQLILPVGCTSFHKIFTTKTMKHNTTQPQIHHVSSDRPCTYSRTPSNQHDHLCHTTPWKLLRRRQDLVDPDSISQHCSTLR